MVYFMVTKLLIPLLKRVLKILRLGFLNFSTIFRNKGESSFHLSSKKIFLHFPNGLTITLRPITFLAQQTHDTFTKLLK